MSTKTTGFDISSIQTSDTTVVELIHPGTGEELGAHLVVYGDDSDHMQKVNRAASAKYATFAQKHNFRKPMPAEQAEEIEMDKDVASVQSFSGFKNGKDELAFSADAVRDIFKRFPSFREQARGARIDRALFIKG